MRHGNTVRGGAGRGRTPEERQVLAGEAEEELAGAQHRPPRAQAPTAVPADLPRKARRRAPSLPNLGGEPVGGTGAPTSQKHQDASVGEHGRGHPVGAGRPARGAPPQCVERRLGSRGAGL